MTFYVNPNRVSRMIDEMFNDRTPARRVTDSFEPSVNILETENDYRLTFEIPGMTKEDINVSIKENVLTVSGERKDVELSENQRYLYRELTAGKFSRAFTLPETVDTEKVSADYKQGLLTITLAKQEAAKPKEIEVKVN